MTQQHAAELNLLAVAIVFLTSLVTLYRLDRAHATEGRFLFRAFLCWVFAWAAWGALWTIEAFHPGPFADLAWRRPTLLVLSDLNTAFSLLFYFGLTRGDDEKPTGYFILGATLAATLLTVDAMLLGVGGRLGQELHDRWSMALSMSAPVLVGWACRLRYGRSSALIIGLLYAVIQPPAQLAVLGAQNDAGRLMSVELGGAVLTMLAILKIIMGAAVTWIVGYEPTTYESLVASGAARRKTVDAWWPKLPAGMALVGVVAVGIFAWMHSPEAFGTVFRRLATGLATLGTLIKIYEVIAKWLDKNIDNRRARA